MDAATIARSLDLVAEHGDPAGRVYARLFALHPEMEALFVRDTNGSIRGNMLAETINALIDFSDANHYGANLMRAEIVNHSHLGVPPELFVGFLTVLRDTFAEILAAEWTTEIDAAWRELLTQVAGALKVSHS